MTVLAKVPWLNGQAPKVLKFAAVGASGIAVNTAALAGFAELAGLHYLLGAVLATQVSSAWNFLWTEVWVFEGRTTSHGKSWRFTMFLITNNAAFVLRGPIIYGLTERLGIHYLASNLISLLALFVFRFAVANHLIWSKSRTSALSLPAGEDA